MALLGRDFVEDAGLLLTNESKIPVLRDVHSQEKNMRIEQEQEAVISCDA